MSPAPTLRIACLAAAALAMSCATPILTQDGKVTFQQAGASGASVITANGVEFIDRKDIPRAIVRRSVNEPWRPSTGFLMPADGVLRRTSTPTPVQGRGLLVLVRPSDTLIPSWGGEVLLRVDTVVPPEAFPKAAASARAPADVVIVLDGVDGNTAPLADVILDGAGQRDHVAVVDSAHGTAVLPPLAGSHQTLLRASVERVLMRNAKDTPGQPRSLAAALAMARGWLSSASPAGHAREIVVITDGIGVAQDPTRVAAEAVQAHRAGVKVISIAAPDGLQPDVLQPLGGEITAGVPPERRQDAAARALPPAGDTVLGDVELEVASVPAPAHVIEVSGGSRASQLDRDLFYLGEMVVGEARTEVARVTLPPWTPGEPLELTITAKYKDLGSGTMQRAKAVVRCRYSNDIGVIASSRNGDVIAYASALAMVHKLQRNFLGSHAEKLAGLKPLITLQATSMARLSRDRRDPALMTQSEILSTLLGVVED